LQRYGEKSFRDLFGISGKWLGLYLEILLDSRGAVWNSIRLRLNFKQRQGPFCKSGRDFSSLELFSNGELQWTQSTTPEPVEAVAHSEPWPWSAEELIEAWPSGRSRAVACCNRGEMERALRGFGFGAHCCLDGDEEVTRQQQNVDS
jgi:hypothetical protein